MDIATVIIRVLKRQILNGQIVFRIRIDAWPCGVGPVDGNRPATTIVGRAPNDNRSARRSRRANRKCFVVSLSECPTGNQDSVASRDASPDDVCKRVPRRRPGCSVTVGAEAVVHIPRLWMARARHISNNNAHDKSPDTTHSSVALLRTETTEY